MNDTENQKAIIYTRGVAFMDQEARCRTLAHTGKYVVTRVFSDLGLGKSHVRPGFESMLEFLGENRQDKYRVLIESPTRLSGNVETCVGLCLRIREAGATVEAAERFAPHLENRPAHDIGHDR